jgi:hypothetical protein
MIPRFFAAALCGACILLAADQSSAHVRPATARPPDANILSPKLCFTLKIAGNWIPAEDQGSYVSPDGKQFVGVRAFDVKDLKDNKGDTLIEKEAAALEKAHEKTFHQKLTSVSSVRFESIVPGTWKWTAAPMREKSREVPVEPRFFVDLSPEGVIVIDIEGAPDADTLARNILATLNVSKAQPCQLPKSTKELLKDLTKTPPPPQASQVAAGEENLPFRLFQNPAKAWGIQFPERWEVRQIAEGRVLISRPGPGDPTSCDIMNRPVQFQSLDEFADFWLRQTAEYMASQGGRVRRTERLRVSLPNGIEGIDVRSEVPGGGRSRTIFALADGVGYVFDCVTSVNSWDNVAPVVAKIIGSFTIEKKQ